MNYGKIIILPFNTTWTFILISALLLLLLTLIVIRRRKKNRLGIRKLDLALQELRKDEMKAIIIPDGIGGLLEVERLILMEQGLLIIESYPMTGHLFGAEKIDQWTQIIDGRSFKFANPLRQINNARHAIQALAPKVPIFCRVVFTDNSNFPKGKPDDVSVLSSLENDLQPIKNKAKMPDLASLAWERIRRIARQDGQALLREAS